MRWTRTGFTSSRFAIRMRSPDPAKPPGTAISPTSLSFSRITPEVGARTTVVPPALAGLEVQLGAAGGVVSTTYGTVAVLLCPPGALTVAVLTRLPVALGETLPVSVKVMLAWSTCAQMGFMLMQCGLGAYSLALLHLLAHSLYKAHAFLAAGGAVEQARLQRLTPLRAAPSAPSAPGTTVTITLPPR